MSFEAIYSPPGMVCGVVPELRLDQRKQVSQYIVADEFDRRIL